MCIIISKEKNLNLPKKQILQTAFYNNNDGAGFMYAHNNKVFILKGFMNFNDFYNKLMEIDQKINLKKTAVIFHFRIATSGKTDAATCHPFPVSNNYKELRKLSTICSLGVAHNGIIPDYVYGSTLSDTQNFTRDFLSYLQELDKNFLDNKHTKNVLKYACNNTKLAFLTSSKKIYYIGDFITDEEGLKFSNTSYKTQKIYNYNYNYNYNDYYYDYYDDYDYDNRNIDNIYYDTVENIKILNDDIYYSSGNDLDETIQPASKNMCADQFYNVYNILQISGKWYKLQLVADDCYFYNNNMESINLWSD